ncbi:MAG: metal-dependent transcriptional regulator [Kiritimatiellae bacterium]|nr:metal-dependent transcriptional regulator [Kiritimatiellia bacterium]
MLSQSVENFVKAVYSLQKSDEWVGTSRLANALGQRPASVTNMAQKLAKSEDGLLIYQAYKGVKLTETGTSVALEVIRHHRLIELYLSKQLGVPWDKVHDEAEKLEHVISEDLEDRMAAALEDPTIDPHGAPIPTKDGHVAPRPSVPLASVEPGHVVEVVEVNDHDAQLLRYLGELDLYPGNRFSVLGRESFGQSISIERDGKPTSLGEEAVPHIFVTVIGEIEKKKDPE